jgi:hypothetical protein
MSFPSTPDPRSIRISSASQTNVSVSHNLRRIVSDRGGHRWLFDIEYPPLSRSELSPLWAFLVSQAGQAESFEFTAPGQSAQGSMSGTPVVSGAAQVGTVLNLSGFTPDATDVLKAGDYIRIAGQYKSYIVTADVDADASGDAAVSIHPALQSSPEAGAAVSAAGIFRCSLASDRLDLDMSTLYHYGIQVSLIEVLD